LKRGGKEGFCFLKILNKKKQNFRLRHGGSAAGGRLATVPEVFPSKERERDESLSLSRFDLRERGFERMDFFG